VEEGAGGRWERAASTCERTGALDRLARGIGAVGPLVQAPPDRSNRTSAPTTSLTQEAPRQGSRTGQRSSVSGQFYAECRLVEVRNSPTVPLEVRNVCPRDRYKRSGQSPMAAVIASCGNRTAGPTPGPKATTHSEPVTWSLTEFPVPNERQHPAECGPRSQLRRLVGRVLQAQPSTRLAFGRGASRPSFQRQVRAPA
jgi:hypothetical protein